MKVLFATWELDPFFKLGGLGDVARSLPFALNKRGVDIRNIIPLYKAVDFGKSRKKKVASFLVQYGGKNVKTTVYSSTNPITQVPVYLVENKKYLDIVAGQKSFAFFNKAVADLLERDVLDWRPDIVHCNDHHCGLIPLLIKEKKIPVSTVMTIHNLAYQGYSPLDVLKDFGISKSKCRIIPWEIKGKRLNFLSEAILNADIITTVSPTYAREILLEEYGMGLERILRERSSSLYGILNGIDLSYNENIHLTSVAFPYKYRNRKMTDPDSTLLDWERGKRLNKLFLQEKLGLAKSARTPLFSFIGRFDPQQKGLDILHRFIRRETSQKYQFVILGTGNADWEERYQWLCTFHPEAVSCNFTYDHNLAHQIYAASDFIIIPSKFEPCGLIQMIAMAFGTLPIAHKTGGLADSIKDGVNGYLFEKNTSVSLNKIVRRAVFIWRHRRKKYRKMVEEAFRTDFSWDRSAGEYLKLYEKLIN